MFLFQPWKKSCNYCRCAFNIYIKSCDRVLRLGGLVQTGPLLEVLVWKLYPLHVNCYKLVHIC